MKAKSLFSGLARFGTAFAVIMALCIGFIAVTSQIQGKVAWYPDLIDIKQEDRAQGGGIDIAHAYVAKLRLETQGEQVVESPRYASCGMTWFGLSLLDYALLAEAA